MVSVYYTALQKHFIKSFFLIILFLFLLIFLAIMVAGHYPLLFELGESKIVQLYLYYF